MKYLLLLICVSHITFAQNFSKDLKSFKSITITSAMQVELILADSYKIVVDGNDSEKLKVDNNKETLKLTTSLSKKFKSDLKVKIFYKEGLRFIKLANNVIFKAKEPVTERFLELETINNVRVDLWLKTEDFIANIDLGSTIVLKGLTGSQKITLKNKSFYDAFNFKSKKTFIKAKTSKAAIYVSDFLDAEAKFKSEITYMGSPFSVNEKTFLSKILVKK